MNRREMLQTGLRSLPALAAGTLAWPQLATVPAQAADWPTKNIRVIVPYAAGAMGDVVTRVLGEELRPKLGQPLIVEVKPGASGNIGTAAVVQAPPDGYTVLVTATHNFVINQHLYPNLGFDPRGLVAMSFRRTPTEFRNPERVRAMERTLLARLAGEGRRFGDLDKAKG